MARARQRDDLRAAAPLPVQLSSFVGRRDELVEAKRLLAGARLLTLTGAGGSGKTRLAIEVATELARPGSRAVGWSELGSLSDAKRVAQHVAEQLGIREERPGSAAQAIVASIGEQPYLLVLDNCEHVVEECARLVEALLRACPALQILATSREAFAIAGERAWLVPPLAADDAVGLFVARAQDALPSFALDATNGEVVAEICTRLDSLPLAIELAAARVRVLSAEQILERLHDRFRLLTGGPRTAIPRHQTLRATIDWSYSLLSAEEQQLLERLSVFSGFTLDAAEAVCSGDGEAWAVLDALAGLVDRSMVAMRESDGSARYVLLETVREYAAERLRERDETQALCRRHAAFFHALVTTAEPHLTTVERRPWLDRVLIDIDNVRAALSWTRDADPELHLQMAGRLCWFWFSTGFWAEGRRWAEDALTLPSAAASTVTRAAALFAAAVIATLQAEFALAQGWIEESLEIARAHRDERLEAYAQSYLGMILVGQARPEGEEPIRAALGYFRKRGDLYGLRLALLMLGTLYASQRAFDRAVISVEEGLEAAKAFGLPREIGIAYQMLGSTVLQQGDTARAAWAFRESLAALRHDPQYMFLARGLEMVGVLSDGKDHALEGVRLLGAGEAQRERISAGIFKTDRAIIEPRVAAMRAALGDAAFAEAWAEGRRLTLRDAIELALARSRAVPKAPALESLERVAHRATVAAKTDTLTVRALGPLEVTLGEVGLESTAWTSAKAKELLLYLLCHPAGCTRQELGLSFWPDSSEAQVKNSFHVLLHRLRKAMNRGDLVVINDYERYQINPDLQVAFDVAQFERDLLGASGASAELEQVLARYGGDFGANEDVGDWHLDIRDRLRQAYLGGLSRLADLYIEAGDPLAATTVLERLVRADDLREDGHRRLMLCYARAGQRERALRQFERLTKTLASELDAKPERQSVQLAERIRRAEEV
jgi:predicted ATPase/DNA-binding SARP family transcriptional activator